MSSEKPYDIIALIGPKTKPSYVASIKKAFGESGLRYLLGLQPNISQIDNVLSKATKDTLIYLDGHSDVIDYHHHIDLTGELVPTANFIKYPGNFQLLGCLGGAAKDSALNLADGQGFTSHSGEDTYAWGSDNENIIKDQVNHYKEVLTRYGRPPDAYDLHEHRIITRPNPARFFCNVNGKVESFLHDPLKMELEDLQKERLKELQEFRKFRTEKLGHNPDNFTDIGQLIDDKESAISFKGKSDSSYNLQLEQKLYQACRDGDIEELSSLLKKQPKLYMICINDQVEKRNALTAAWNNGHIEILDLLFETFSESKESFLTQACKNNDIYLAEYLLGKGAYLNTLASDIRIPDEIKALSIDIAKEKFATALENLDVPILQDILENNKLPEVLVNRTINAQFQQDVTALESACISENTEAIKLLTKYGANPNIADEQGGTAVSSCCYTQNLEHLQIMLGAGGNPSGGYNSEHLSLFIAMEKDNLDMFNLLLNNGADITYGKYNNALNILILAAAEGKEKFVDAILSMVTDSIFLQKTVDSDSMEQYKIDTNFEVPDADLKLLGKNASQIAQEKGFTDIADKIDKRINELCKAELLQKYGNANERAPLDPNSKESGLHK
ncbi:MAG: hypothetical protein K0R98_1794 [Rickettsiaceae bacterium]|jgi:ankyrin repeat protein|nr:hypothetical protein [Rickettsiaceae bacterium]